MFLRNSLYSPLRVRSLYLVGLPQYGVKSYFNKSLTTKPTEVKPRIKVEPLKDRRIVRVHGDEVAPFLQGLITNDINHLRLQSGFSPIDAQSLYTMILNKAGRVLYDCIIYRSADPKTVFLECDAKVEDDLCKHLKVYRVRRNIQIDKFDEYKPWTAYQADVPINTLNMNTTNVHTTMIITKDPRVPQLGYRMLMSPSIHWAEANLIFQNESEPKVMPSSKSYNYRIHRYRLGVGEGVIDLPPGKCFPLESNCDFLHGVSFHKGCYVGQEVTARVHHTGVIRKRLLPVKLSSPITPLLYEQNSVKIQSDDGVHVGTMRGSIADYALALVRLEEIHNKKLFVDGQPCKVIKPNWWPTESPKRLREMN